MTQSIEQIRVPYLTRKRIEREAQLLLAEFQQSGEWDGVFPVPMETLLEIHLGLTMDFHDLVALGYPDALGALKVTAREVLIDRALDPSTFPDVEGRYRFTLAHEVGHWLLHRHWITKYAPDDAPPVCRASQARESIEWQADYFAASLLMPRPEVHRVWRDYHGGVPITSDRFRPHWHKIIADETERSGFVPENEIGEEDMVLAFAARAISEQFAVSPTAMRIRLEQLGLMLRASN